MVRVNVRARVKVLPCSVKVESTLIDNIKEWENA
jgi:hypothetical protein